MFVIALVYTCLASPIAVNNAGAARGGGTSSECHHGVRTRTGGTSPASHGGSQAEAAPSRKRKGTSSTMYKCHSIIIDMFDSISHHSSINGHNYQLADHNVVNSRFGTVHLY